MNGFRKIASKREKPWIQKLFKVMKMIQYVELLLHSSVYNAKHLNSWLQIGIVNTAGFSS